MGLAALSFEIFSKKFFGEVPDPFELHTGRNFRYLSLKKWGFEIFGTSNMSRLKQSLSYPKYHSNYLMDIFFGK